MRMQYRRYCRPTPCQHVHAYLRRSRYNYRIALMSKVFGLLAGGLGLGYGGYYLSQAQEISKVGAPVGEIAITFYLSVALSSYVVRAGGEERAKSGRDRDQEPAEDQQDSRRAGREKGGPQ